MCPATFCFCESNTVGETLTATQTQMNWKSNDTSANDYASNPIVASGIGGTSVSKWIFGRFTGPFNNLLNGYWDHTSQGLGTSFTIKGAKSMTADGDRALFITPGSSYNTATMSTDYTPANGTFPTSAKNVYFGATGPANSGKASTIGAGTMYTNYLCTQFLVASDAQPGDTSSATFTLRYDEN